MKRNFDDTVRRAWYRGVWMGILSIYIMFALLMSDFLWFLVMKDWYTVGKILFGVFAPLIVMIFATASAAMAAESYRDRAKE